MRTERSALSARSLVSRLSAHSRPFAWGMALGALLLTGCPGTLDHKERFLMDAGSAGNGTSGGGDAAAPVEAGVDADAAVDAGPCGDVAARIFIPSCGGTGCHGAVSPQQGLDLVSPGLAARVVGVPGTGCVSTLADPANPEASLLYQKLSPSPPCGAPMPLARPALSGEDAACVLAWIAAQ